MPLSQMLLTDLHFLIDFHGLSQRRYYYFILHLLFFSVIKKIPS